MLEDMSPDEIIFHTFDAMRRVFIVAESIDDARQLDNRFFELLNEVAKGDVTLFPGIADISLKIDREIRLSADERSALAQSLQTEMRLDREIASRLIDFINR